MKKIKNVFVSQIFSKYKALLAFLFLILLFQQVIFAQSVTTITITNARQTTYTKDPESGNDTIVLEGSVELSVSKDSTASEIKADKITYDRQTEMLYAEGNVEIITKSSSSGGETTTASALLMNTSTLEGVFDDGRVVQTQSDALNLPSGSTLIVFSDIFGKSESNTIAFKDSSLTFCDDSDPHWHIDASRTWLLPGGEFAFFNAFLYVGYVPVLYLPAFYYPKDELIFNPVFSHLKREGYAIQNTIYLYGRKPLDNSSSTSTSSDNDSTSAESLKALYNFMKPSSLKEQKLEGLVLHNLDEDYTGNTSNYIKIMADNYSNLGSMLGLEGNVSPAPKYISTLKFNAYIGLSNTVFEDSSGNYINYNPYLGEVIKDSSTFLGMTLPFRYSGDLEFTLTKPFKLSLSLPFYSDPFFAYDFKDNRSETMDWISYFMDSSSVDDQTVTISEVTSFTWSLSASYSPTMPAIIKPYVSSFSTSIKSSLLISSMKADSKALLEEFEDYDSNWTYYTPYRKFYYPSQITPLSASLSVSGTIFKWPKDKASSTGNKPSYAITLNKPQELKKESEIQAEKEESEKEALAAEKNTSVDDLDAKSQLQKEIELDETDKYVFDKSDFVKPSIPDLAFSATTNSTASGLTYNLGYSIAPSINTQISYASSNLKKSQDFDWGNIRSFMYTVKIPLSLTSALKYGGDFFTLTNKLSYDPVYQKHPIISTEEDIGGYTKSSKNSLILADYNAESQNVSTTNSFSFKPFAYTKHFADTGLSWNSTIKLYRKKFIGDAENPEWEEYTLDFENDDCVTVNSLDLTLSSAEFDKKFKQTLVLTSVMPPLLRQYNARLNLVFPYVTTSFSSGYQEQTHEDVDLEEKWKWSDFQQSMTISLFDSSLKFTQSYNYDIEEKQNDSLKISAVWKSMNLSYVMSYSTAYDFDEEEGWVAKTGDEEKKFQPYSLSFSFAPSTKTFYRWFNRISIAPGINTSIVADLIRPTNSYLIFSPSLTFKITEFFNLTFSSTSRNQVLYRYIQKYIGKEGLLPGESNIIKDLINSYRFDDMSLRTSSGFKLKSLNMTMSHELHDWSFNMTYKIEPKLVTKSTGKTYDATPYITIGIVWNPMESIKSNLVYEYDTTEEKGIWSLD